MVKGSKYDERSGKEICEKIKKEGKELKVRKNKIKKKEIVERDINVVMGGVEKDEKIKEMELRRDVVEKGRE